jgi:hypothetical protein
VREGQEQQQIILRWLGASGAVLAGLVLAAVGTTFVLDGGTAVMDRVPWILVLLVTLMAILGLAGISLVRARRDAAIVVFLTSAMFGLPLALWWALLRLSGD